MKSHRKTSARLHVSSDWPKNGSGLFESEAVRQMGWTQIHSSTFIFKLVYLQTLGFTNVLTSFKTLLLVFSSIRSLYRSLKPKLLPGMDFVLGDVFRRGVGSADPCWFWLYNMFLNHRVLQVQAARAVSLIRNSQLTSNTMPRSSRLTWLTVKTFRTGWVDRSSRTKLEHSPALPRLKPATQ